MLAAMKLLIVDDHSIMRAGFAVLLAQPGSEIDVVQAGDAADGIAAVEVHADLDAVFLDLNMPGEGGLHALRRLKIRPTCDGRSPAGRWATCPNHPGRRH
jgi:CheY-like chemotaxis protein